MPLPAMPQSHPDAPPRCAEADPSLPRFEHLSSLAGVLPYHRRDQLSELLTDADAATLRHLAEQGMGANTLRAITSDLAYFER